MKGMIPLILTFLLYNLSYAQHISEFSSLKGQGQDSNFNLPDSHTFQLIIETGDDLSDGNSMPGTLKPYGRHPHRFLPPSPTFPPSKAYSEKNPPKIPKNAPKGVNFDPVFCRKY